MGQKEIRPVSILTEDVQAWYTAGEAAKKLIENSKRPVLPSYVSKLGSLGKVRTYKIHDRLVLYSKEDIDAYQVEPRGKKSGEAAQARSKTKRSSIQRIGN
jgi:hypothetical protein